MVRRWRCPPEKLRPACSTGASSPSGFAAITSSRKSTLGKMSDLVVEMPVPQEACPFNLAPTTSTTALLVLGDALAMVLLDERGFTKSDYGRLHPGGAIGRMVTMCACDVMRPLDRSALVSLKSTVRETLFAMNHARCGSAIVVDKENRLLGIFTDGDFRRWAEREEKERAAREKEAKENARKKAEADAAKKLAEAEAAAKRKAEADAAEKRRAAADAEAKRKADAEARRKAEEAAAKTRVEKIEVNTKGDSVVPLLIPPVE